MAHAEFTVSMRRMAHTAVSMRRKAHTAVSMRRMAHTAVSMRRMAHTAVSMRRCIIVVQHKLCGCKVFVDNENPKFKRNDYLFQDKLHG